MNQSKEMSDFKFDNTYHLINNLRPEVKDNDNLTCYDQDILEADVILVFNVNGYSIMNSISSLFKELKPQIHFKQVNFNNNKAFLITAESNYLKTSATNMGLKFDSHLTSQQRQTIIRYYLNKTKWFQESSSFDLKTSSSLGLINGEAIIPKLIKLKLIQQMLPLHDETDLLRLRKIWITKIFSAQPLQEIYQYFGFNIAMYFAFLGYYTYALSFPATFGLLVTFWSITDKANDFCYKILLSILVIFWSIFYLESWKSYQLDLVKQWQPTFSNQAIYTRRPQYYGDIVQKSNKFCIIYPQWKRTLFFYLVSVPVMALSLLTVFLTMLYMLHFQNWWDSISSSTLSWASYVPQVCFGCIIYVMDVVYHKIARWLNKKENYENEEAYESNLLLKYIFFQFVNSFLSPFYIAFYIGDIEKLREQLTALFITRQVIGNLKETVWPFLTQSFRLSTTLSYFHISQSEFESNLYRYESTFEDYLELYIQFGYVTMFASTFSLGAFCAFINNLIEIRSDAFKLCVTFQRPFGSQSISNTVMWQNAMNVMVYITIFVNGLLIAKFGIYDHVFFNLNNWTIVAVCIILEVSIFFLNLLVKRINYSIFSSKWFQTLKHEENLKKQ